MCDKDLEDIAELLRDKKFQEAFDICSRAIEENPQNAEAHFKMAWVQERLRKTNFAEQEYNIAIQLQKNLVRKAAYLYFRGRLFFKQKKYVMSLSDFTLSI